MSACVAHAARLRHSMPLHSPQPATALQAHRNQRTRYDFSTVTGEMELRKLR